LISFTSKEGWRSPRSLKPKIHQRKINEEISEKSLNIGEKSVNIIERGQATLPNL
jgi:hypothetical protein